METFPEIYQPKPKFFKEKAERIQKPEYDAVVAELMSAFTDRFNNVRAVEQLEDKDSFGDIDLICFPKQQIDETQLKNIFGEKLLGYRHDRNSHTYSTLLKLSYGKQVHVDFIQASNETDFERKYMYYSKGHLSSIVGVLAKKLNFKYGTEGFFKKFQDKRGNWHDILISENLRDGLIILGLDADAYDKISNTEDIISFMAKSPFFDNKDLDFDNLTRKDRESIKRNKQEEYISRKLLAKKKTREISDENEFLKKLFPDKFSHFEKEAERINKELYTVKYINGEKVMEIFKLKPGPQVGRVLKFISEHYPEAEELSEEIIDAVKTKILK